MNEHSRTAEISKPKQARSKKTMENILDTAQQMLIDRTFDKSNIQEIVKKANSSVGSFYSLFKTKNNLLECLLDRYQNWLIEIVQDFNKQDIPKDIVNRSTILIQEYIKISRKESGMLRARHIYNITRRKSIPASRLKKNQQFLHELERFFKPCMQEINHPEPEKALTFILTVLDIFIENKIIFEDVFNESPNDLSIHELEKESIRLFLNYLQINNKWS